MSKDNQAASQLYLDAYNVKYGDVGLGWRKIGARYKAQHCIDIAQKNNIKPKRVLEYGAGTGDILKYLSEWNFADEYYAAEINPESCKMIQEAGIDGLVEARQFDGYHTGFDDGYFDLVILSHVLEHVEFERLVLREMKRISSHHIIEVPLDYSHNVDKNAEHFMSYGHINVYKPGLLRFLLKTEGFSILDGFANLTEEPVRAYKVFILDKSMEDTKENRLKVHDDCKKQLDEFNKLPELQKELAARDYTVLCRSGEGSVKIMG